MELRIGLDVISSYRRLSYTPWHALAEFVDNSTQSYFNNRTELDRIFADNGERLEVSISYDPDVDGGLLIVSDNAAGMSYEELEAAMHIARRPRGPTGRSRYGLGMKTAACWIGNSWKVRTKRFGETEEHVVTVDVNRIAHGDSDLQYSALGGRNPRLHYTIIEVRDHNHRFQGRTLGKIKEFLRSMYRRDLMDGTLWLTWRDQPLTWEGLDDELLKSRDGSLYKREFEFAVNGKAVRGWVGILDRGSRAKAGFSILHSGRVIRGWPDSWRPTPLFGQFQGSNDLVNQRLVGEVFLDEFEVSHTKDDIVWLDDEQERVEEGLREACWEYREIARHRRRREEDEQGPNQAEVDVAVNELRRELESSELIDKVVIENVPPPELVSDTRKAVIDASAKEEEAFRAQINHVVVRGFLGDNLSPNDPYVTIDAAKADEVVVVINMQHPHVRYIKGSDGLLNYLRHCTYDALAEWKALHKAGSLNPETVKLIKDGFLRVRLELEFSASS